MLDRFQPRPNITSFPDPSAVPGYSACLSEPPSRRPTDRTKSPAGLRFRKSDEDPVPHEDDLASAMLIDETPEDRESIADTTPADRAYNRLVHYIYDRVPHSQTDSAPYMPPRCEFEEFFATSESASSAKPNLELYPRVNEILES